MKNEYRIWQWEIEIKDGNWTEQYILKNENQKYDWKRKKIIQTDTWKWKTNTEKWKAKIKLKMGMKNKNDELKI